MKYNVFIIISLLVVILASCLSPPPYFENEAPLVDAGNDFSITVGETKSLNGLVSDDGYPNPPGIVYYQWIKVNGPGIVSFSSPSETNSIITFDTEGTYTLRLIANDSLLVSHDDIVVTVNSKTISPSNVGEWVESTKGSISGRMILETENGITYAYMPYGDSTDFDGEIRFDFRVTEQGLYKILAYQYSSSLSNNSFFVGLESDNAKGNDDMAWDSSTSNSFIDDEVNWRNADSRLDPKIWELDSGIHSFIFYGREPSTKLARIMLVKVDDEIQCTCTEWEDSIVGGGSCSSSQMQQTRICTPASCDVTERCIAYSSPDEEVKLYETIEKTFSNPSITGNPYDLIATAEFTHSTSGDKIITELYYVDNNNYEFKFTGTKLGVWNYVTKSSDNDLNGKTGTFNVISQTNDKIKGFLTHVGNKYAVPDYEGKMEAYLFHPYMNLNDYGSITNQLDTESKITNFLNEAENMGFNAIFVGIGSPGLWMTGSSGNVDPRLSTFERVERLIEMTHERGMHVHLWLWGDKDSGKSPYNFDGGINGYVDRRLQRYIAARLGPMPGWSMGYGYDLHEWTTISQLNSWASYMHDKFGYDHLLSTRAYKLSSSSNNIISYEGVGRSVPLTTTAYGPKDYAEVLSDIKSDTSRPHLYEERHTYLRPNYNLDMEGTRRLLWWQAMAGGVGSVYGYYGSSTTSVYRGHPYPNPEQLRAYREFWSDKFKLDMDSCNDLTSDGVSLCSKGKYYVFYKENTNSINMDLSGLSGSLSVIVMNTKTGQYTNVGTKTNSYNKFVAPTTSDWVVYVKKI